MLDERRKMRLWMSSGRNSIFDINRYKSSRFGCLRWRMQSVIDCRRMKSRMENEMAVVFIQNNLMRFHWHSFTCHTLHISRHKQRARACCMFTYSQWMSHDIMEKTGEGKFAFYFHMPASVLYRKLNISLIFTFCIRFAAHTSDKQKFQFQSDT